jgi:hypothetical protein
MGGRARALPENREDADTQRDGRRGTANGGDAGLVPARSRNPTRGTAFDLRKAHKPQTARKSHHPSFPPFLCVSASSRFSGRATATSNA